MLDLNMIVPKSNRDPGDQLTNLKKKKKKKH